MRNRVNAGVAVLLGVMGLAVIGCEKKPAAPAPATPAARPAQGSTPTPSGTAPTPSAGGEMHDHDKFADLGKVQIGAWEVHVKGEVEPGKEGHFDLVLSGSSEKPAAVRVWIGAKDGRGAMKHKADGDGKEYHAHADVPNPIAADTMLWVEVENAKGEKTVGGVALKH